VQGMLVCFCSGVSYLSVSARRADSLNGHREPQNRRWMRNVPLGDIRGDSTLVHEPVSKKHRAEAFLVDSPEVLSVRQKEP